MKTSHSRIEDAAKSVPPNKSVSPNNSVPPNKSTPSNSPKKSQPTTLQNPPDSKPIFQHIFDQEVDPVFARRSAYIINHLHKAKSRVVLDAGCGRGYYVKLISMLPTTTKVVGIDINKDYLQRAHAVVKNEPKAELKQASIYELPFKENTFDAVVCSEILEHLVEDERALKEIRRVLKPHGALLISVPHVKFPFLWDPLNWILMHVFNTHVHKDRWWLAGIWADHERLYSKQELFKKIRGAGFKIQDNEELVRWSWPLSHFFLYGIGKNLVERFGASGFDRFNFEKPKPLSSMLAAFMRFPSTLLDKRIPMKASINLVVFAQK